MRDVKAYLEPAEFEVLAVTSQPHTATKVVSLNTQQGHKIALDLARQGFEAALRADALLLAGGAWQSLVAAIAVEKEYGRPIVTNPTSGYYAALKHFGLTLRRKGFGALLDSLF